jgi:hypothetical protein
VNVAGLYTVNFEYKGGTYLAQVEASSLEDVLKLWLKQIPDDELVRWKASRSEIAETFISEMPIAIQGLRGVWCVSRTVAGSFALANIVATDQTA